jgi:cold shock CspA family protein
METPAQISYEGFKAPERVRERVTQGIAHLETLFGRITACRVAVKAPGHRHRKGGLFEVHIHLTLPDGREVVATRNPPADHAHEDILVAIRDAFRAAERRLQDEAREMRGRVKAHAYGPFATVRSLFPEHDYGFLESADGNEIYFHRNSVLGDAFDSLEIGDRVAFVEEEGEKGPQASTVRLLGKHALR